MYSFRGDAHKTYLRLKKAANKNQSFKHMKELLEIEEIQGLYQKIDSSTLKLIYYRMIKEKNGSGIVPLFVTAVPWFFFLFSKQLQEFLFKEGSILWVIFGFIYFFTLTITVVIHFREKAWAAIHIEIIQDILNERTELKSNKDSSV
ncbi:hypothetical protein PY093_02110 [Cytobacillus sp. S13-E01]|uniref:hypothetical protein n=1 Tax=Cytobacillus sp. S13-E01 TaxID=3031326 RepID=UPI0023D8C0F6|nr:hypothetical protein [Cytobacillus sp. S13-E01]MDF0725505.1 hypothetical protein [Cytobacillus sp. S13-E01]